MDKSLFMAKLGDKPNLNFFLKYEGNFKIID